MIMQMVTIKIITSRGHTDATCAAWWPPPADATRDLRVTASCVAPARITCRAVVLDQASGRATTRCSTACTRAVELAAVVAWLFGSGNAITTHMRSTPMVSVAPSRVLDQRGRGGGRNTPRASSTPMLAPNALAHCWGAPRSCPTRGYRTFSRRLRRREPLLRPPAAFKATVLAQVVLCRLEGLLPRLVAGQRWVELAQRNSFA